MTFHRLQSQQALSAALMLPAMVKSGPVHTDAHVPLAALAFALLLLRHLGPMWRRRRNKRAATWTSPRA